MKSQNFIFIIVINRVFYKDFGFQLTNESDSES